jgi:hypothetical protein
MSRLNGVGLPSAAVSYIAPYVTEEELLATNLLSAANGEFVVSQLKALVDPTYPFVDNFLGNSFLPDRHITNIHAMTPLQGCVSGTMCAYGVNGECVNDFYCELSHAVGLSGLRHRRKLISLPAMYTDIYQRVSVTAELMHLQMLLLV